MAKFKYRAYDQAGRLNKGLIEAPTFQLALEDLRSQELYIVKLFDQGTSLLYRDLNMGGPKVKTEHFTVFCRQLATMYKSGIGMMESIKILSEQTASKPFRKVLDAVAEDMRTGTQFSTAVAAYPTVFTTVFVNMIRAGEASGNLDEMLERLAVFFEKEHYTKEKVKSAMVYPAIMGVVTVMVVIFMMIFVIPNYVANFEALGIELPLPTVIVMEISNFIQNFWYIVLLLLFVPSLLIYLIKKHPQGQYMLDYMNLKVPVFGKLRHKQAIARFSRTFSSLFSAAIPMLQTLTIVSHVVGNEVIGKLIAESREGVRGGQALADPFQNSWLFPEMVVQMISIGERSGNLDGMLEKVADFYEADVDTMADRLKSLLEPIMILLLAGIVGGIVLAVLMPTFAMMEGI